MRLLPAAALAFLAAEPAAALPARLVLALDGAAYHHVRALQAGEGGRRCFAGFKPASRLISTYPSLSDVAWADIFGLEPLESYQPLHYSYARNELSGARGLESMGDTPEYLRRMDWHLTGSWTNLAGYLFPRRVFRRELRRVRKAFLSSERPEFYALVHTVDYAVHMGRDPADYLCAVDAWAEGLRRERAGLQIVILSDHGTDDLVPRRLPIPEHLERSGFRVVKRLERRGDVVLPVDGMLNVVQAFPFVDDIPAVAAALAALPGVDLVTVALPDRRDEVRVLKRGEEAVVRRRGARYAYEAVRGDPLLHAPVAAALRRSGAADARGFASGDAWLAATLEHPYPAALERVMRGHSGLVRSPAPVIASLAPGRVSVNRPTWIGSRLVSLGGTHGALDARSSGGVALSTAKTAPDTTTDRVRAHFGGLTGLKP